MDLTRYRVIGIFVILEIVAIISLYIFFSRVESAQSRAVTTLVGSLLRDESAVSNSYLLARYLEDMHTIGALICARLEQNTTKSSNRPFYDSTFKKDCRINSMEKISLNGLDGNLWTLQILPYLDRSFYFIKWSSVFLLTALIFTASLTLDHFLRKEQLKLELAEKRGLFFEQLTDQVRHDVASPISAMKIIADRAPLDFDTRRFLNEAVLRTEGVLASLRNSDNRSEWINLRDEIEKIINEKKIVISSFPEVTVTLSKTKAFVPRSEFCRSISNLLDNAFQAGATNIKISGSGGDKSYWISFGDNGTPIPEEVKTQLGQLGNTFGKERGSGLGLFQAFNFARSLGGNLSLGDTHDDKVMLKLATTLFL